MKRSAHCHGFMMCLYMRPSDVDTALVQRGASFDDRDPVRGPRTQQSKPVAVLCDGSLRSPELRTVGLVHQNDIGKFHDAALDPLQLVTPKRQQQYDEDVGHLRTRGLGLPHSHGLYDDEIESCRFIGGIADGHGRGIYILDTSSPTITRITG